MEREVSFYGEEATGLAPQDLYSKGDADNYLKEAAYVLAHCHVVVHGRERK
jgi:hypothetical protein